MDLVNALPYSHANKQAIKQLLQRINQPLGQASGSVRQVGNAETHPAGGLKHSFHGNLYQLKLNMYFYYRALALNYYFRLATEWEDAEKFDDLVFQYEDDNQRKKYRFLQAKHKLDETKKITIADLFTEEKNGEFNLEKYFISYLRIKNNRIFNGEFEDFIIATNIDLDLDKTFPGQIKFNTLSRGKNQNKVILVDEILTQDVFFSNAGSRYKLQSSGDLVDHLKNGREVIKEIQGKNININLEIKDFLEKFILAVNQPNEKKLSELMKSELGEHFNLIDADFIYGHFEKEMLDWMKEKGQKGAEGAFLSPTEGKQLFQFISEKISKLQIAGPTSIYSRKLNNLGVVFQDPSLQVVKDFFTKNSKQILYIISSAGTTLSAIKTNQVLHGYSHYFQDDSYIFIHIENLFRLQETILTAFQAETTGKLLVIICKNGDSGIQTINDLYVTIKKILKEKTNKKIIFITTNSNDETMRALRKQCEVEEPAIGVR